VAQQPVLRLLFDLYRRRTSGLLVARDGELRKDIYLNAGDIIFLSSNIPSERFGQYLVGRGRLDQHDLTVALDSMHTDNHRFGETLIRLGLLDQEELTEELRAHHLERLADLCSWVTGRCELFAEREVGGDHALDVRLPVPTLLLGAVRAMPETTLAALVDRHRKQVLVLRAPEVTDSFSFTELEWRVIDKLNGQRPVAEIVATYPRGSNARQATQAALYLLLALDLVKVNTPASR
jgi:hypothetical protein